MKRRITLFSLAVVIAGVVAFASIRNHAKPAAVAAKPAADVVAAPGRVEPKSENVQIGAELNGKLRQVNDEEGDRVRRGQLLAVLENADYAARIASAEAQVEQKQAELRKVVNGARKQERREAQAAVVQSEAVLRNAETEMQRRKQLFAAGVVSREENDRYAREYDVAKAQYEAAAQHFSFVDAEAREEDRSAAEADLQFARAQLAEARAMYDKTFIRSPIDGTVLRKHHRTGESVSNSASAPDPIYTIGDESRLRVRVEVDETDVAKLRVGQSAYVTADAYGDRKFWGRVVRIGEELGRKNVHTDQPQERVDTKILETLVELDPGTDMPSNLRVDAFILTRAEVAQK
jgi:HlyD family secretion protein